MTITERIRLATKLGYEEEAFGLCLARDGWEIPTHADPMILQGYREGRAILEFGEGL